MIDVSEDDGCRGRRRVAAKPHRCDETCLCAVHGTALIYSPALDDHACQDPSCKYAHGGAPVTDPESVAAFLARHRADQGGETDYQLWNTEPYIERVAPLAERIQLAHQNGKVYRRRIIVVEDWTEVDAP